MRIASAIRQAYVAEFTMGRYLRRTGRRHAADPDVTHLCRTLADRCDTQLRRLAPLAERYRARMSRTATDRPWDIGDAIGSTASEAISPLPVAGRVLLADLRKLYLTSHDAEIAWLILVQGARAVRDADLVEVARDGQQQAQVRWQWVRTRIKETSPQVIAAGRGS